MFQLIRRQKSGWVRDDGMCSVMSVRVCVCVSVSDVLRQERGVYTDATILFSAEGTRRAVWTQWIHQLGQTRL